LTHLSSLFLYLSFKVIEPFARPVMLIVGAFGFQSRLSL
jgi:hypothetical protein